MAPRHVLAPWNSAVLGMLQPPTAPNCQGLRSSHPWPTPSAQMRLEPSWTRGRFQRQAVPPRNAHHHQDAWIAVPYFKNQDGFPAKAKKMGTKQNSFAFTAKFEQSRCFYPNSNMFVVLNLPPDTPGLTSRQRRHVHTQYYRLVNYSCLDGEREETQL